MEQLRTLFVENAPLPLVLSGLLIGLVFGAIVLRTNFCTMGGISDMLTLGDTRRFRAWLLAIAVAMVGAQALTFAGVVDTSNTMYVGPSFTWLGNLIGGFLFGLGMVYAGGCASRNVARVGSGDLRAVVTLLVMGVFAYMTISGLLALPRQSVQQFMAIDMPALGADDTNLGAAFANAAGLEKATGGLVLALVIAGALAAFIFADARFRKAPVHIFAGLGIGACIVAGWLATGLAYDEFADEIVRPISLTFVRPTGDTIDWIQRSTALGWPSFGVASVFGAIIGAFIAALSMGRFHLQTFADTNDTLRTLAGAALMGIGGVTALGCTVGQAMTGVSTLAIGSFLSFAAIVAGGVAGVRALEWQLMREAEAA